MSNTEPAVELQQRQQEFSENKDCSTWGDKIGTKANEVVRISFQNINGFGYKYKDRKAERIREYMEEIEVDIMLMAEINVNWRIIGRINTINSVTRGWFDNQKVNTSYNQRCRTCKEYQPGGTAIIKNGETALKAEKSGQDRRGKGRWSWQLLRGKNNIRLRVVSVYFPIAKK